MDQNSIIDNNTNGTESSSELTDPVKSQDVIADTASAEEKLPDPFAGGSDPVKLPEEQAAAGDAPAVDIEQTPTLNSDSEKKSSIPAYIPKPKPAKTEVDNLRDVPEESKPTTDSPIKNNKIWIWILVAAAVLIILCLYSIVGLGILGST